MKKFLALILALVMSLSLVACGGGSNDAQGSGDDATATGKVYYLNFKPEQDEAWQNLAKAYTEETGVPGVITGTLCVVRCDRRFRYLRGDPDGRHGQDRRPHPVPGERPRGSCQLEGLLL